MELLVLIQREYGERVRNKTFIVSTILGLFAILALSFAPAIMDKIKSSDKSQIAILEQNGQVTTYLDEQLQNKFLSCVFLFSPLYRSFSFNIFFIYLTSRLIDLALPFVYSLLRVTIINCTI